LRGSRTADGYDGVSHLVQLVRLPSAAPLPLPPREAWRSWRRGSRPRRHCVAEAHANATKASRRVSAGSSSRDDWHWVSQARRAGGGTGVGTGARATPKHTDGTGDGAGDAGKVTPGKAIPKAAPKPTTKTPLKTKPTFVFEVREEKLLPSPSLSAGPHAVSMRVSVRSSFLRTVPPPALSLLTALRLSNP
jgi:hypothetical protein